MDGLHISQAPISATWARIDCLHGGNPGNSMAVYCLPTASGSVSSYFELAKLLGSDHPVYGIQLPKEMQEQKPFSSVQELIASFVGDIVTQHNGARICLIGYSFAGRLAIELARQLIAHGQPAPLAAMIYAAPPAAALSWRFRIKHFAENVGPWARTLGPWARRGVKRMLTSSHYRARYRAAAIQHLNSASRRLAGRHAYEGAGWYQELPKARRRFFDSNQAMGRQYRFQGIYRGTIVLFRDTPSSGERANPFWPRHLEDYGWRGVTGAKVHVVPVPGDHGSCMQEPYVAELAKALRRALASAEAGSL